MFSCPCPCRSFYSQSSSREPIPRDSECRSTKLCRGLDLGQSLALLESLLLLESHNLEAVKVRQVLPPLHAVALLGPVALLPLGVNLGLLPQLLNSAVPGAAQEIFDDELRQQTLGQGNGLPGNGKLGVGGGAVDENLRFAC